MDHHGRGLLISVALLGHKLCANQSDRHTGPVEFGIEFEESLDQLEETGVVIVRSTEVIVRLVTKVVGD